MDHNGKTVSKLERIAGSGLSRLVGGRHYFAVLYTAGYPTFLVLLLGTFRLWNPIFPVVWLAPLFALLAYGLTTALLDMLLYADVRKLVKRLDDGDDPEEAALLVEQRIAEFRTQRVIEAIMAGAASISCAILYALNR